MMPQVQRAAIFLAVFAVCQWAFEGFPVTLKSLVPLILPSVIATVVYAAVMAVFDRIQRKTE